MICGTCGRNLGKKSLELMHFYFGEDLDPKDVWCKRCDSKGVDDLLDNLSEAMHGEPGHYDSFDDIDVDDFPGHKG